VKVLVIDDHPLVSEALRNVINALDRRAQILDAGSGEEGLARARENPDIDLVVLDLMLPGMNGMTVLSELRREFIALPVLVLSSAAERETVERAIRRGASGFITKSTSKAAMTDAIVKVLAGEIVVPSETMLSRVPLAQSSLAQTGAPIAQGNAALSPAGMAYYGRGDAVLADTGHPAGRVLTAGEPQAPGTPRRLSNLQRRNARRLGLTTRETEVLERLLSGDSNKSIADALGLAESTIKAHCSTIFRLLKVASRSQALSRIHEGMLDGTMP
jgi:DNA-binding NarL/FixJ family response regulator